VIKEDIKRVLDRMQVQYRETKGGFECIHLPSIDINSVQTGQQQPHHQQMSSGSTDGPRTSVVKKASKLSFGMKRDKGKERDSQDKEARPSSATPIAASQSGSSSFFNVSSNTTAVVADAMGNAVNANGIGNGNGGGAGGGGSIDEGSVSSPASGKPKLLPPIPQEISAGGAGGVPTTPISINPPTTPKLTGAVDREVFESMGNNTLSVRFEINIVKVSLSPLYAWLRLMFVQVPWLPLHGIQFRRVGGDGWQYQMLARRVLTELKL
jgi:serine/threonine protein kinase KIN1/2